MLGLFVVLFAAFFVKRMWPGGAIFLVVFSGLSLAFTIITTAPNRARFGESVDLSFGAIAVGYLVNLLINTLFFVGAYVARRWFERRAAKRKAGE